MGRRDFREVSLEATGCQLYYPARSGPITGGPVAHVRHADSISPRMGRTTGAALIADGNKFDRPLATSGKGGARDEIGHRAGGR
jgi:hypothetical protein